MNLQEKISVFYQYFYIKYIGNSTYLFIPTNSEIKSIKNFIKWMEEYYGKYSFGFDKTFEYFTYQFCHYSKPEAIKTRRFLKPGHVFSEKSIERFLNKNFYSSNESKEWAFQNGINVNEIEQIINSIENPISINDLEEIERKRFLNTDYGFTNCIQLTSGFKKNSKNCIICKFSIDCRQIKN